VDAGKSIKRLGFACKWIDRPDQVDGIKATDDAKQYNTGGTTITWLNRQKKEVAEQKLWDIMVQNIESTRKLVERVGGLDEQLHMVRLSSDLLPVYTHRDWSWFWKQSDTISYCEKHFAEIGCIARDRNIRLSFHPGQFTVLASDNPDIVERSIEEFEYHADLARYMGYGLQFQDLKINVHIAGRAGPAGIRRAYSQLSPEARNCITIENEENAWGLNDCLSISDIVPIVLDVHHHWCREGEYIQHSSDMVQRVVDSWRGVRPVLHYSVSREDYLVGHSGSSLPNYAVLLESGYKKSKLRAHSDFYWNTAVNEWALSFLDRFDIIAESKGKNLASFELARQARELGLL
jgi:UV DNA damage repair endonuclease